VPSTPCLTCGTLTQGSYCAAHQPSYRHPGRGSGSASQAFRAAVLAKTGGACAIPGCPTARDRVQAHHVIGLNEGGSNDPETNGQVLCHGHHMAIERQRARVRSPDARGLTFSDRPPGTPSDGPAQKPRAASSGSDSAPTARHAAPVTRKRH